MIQSQDRSRPRRFAGSMAAIAFALLACATCATAADFIRGDANEDGEVSLADTRVIGMYLFQTPPTTFACLDAMDVDNNGEVQVTDIIKLTRFIALGDAPPAAPFPSAGPDPAGSHAGCDSYGGGQPMEDASARLQVRGSLAASAGSGHASITLTLSSSRSLFGYQVILVDEAGVIATDANGKRDYRGVVVELTGLREGGFLGALADGPQINVNFSTSFHVSTNLPPAEDRDVLQIPVCLKAGTPAGEYPLRIEFAELTDFNTGRVIKPQVEEGSFVLESPVGSSPCAVDEGPDESVLFKLEDARSSRGRDVDIPFTFATNRGSTSLVYSIDFNEEALELVSVENTWSRPDGAPIKLLHFEAFSENNIPGDNGLNEGTLGGIYHASYAHEGIFFPVDQEIQLMTLHFRVKPDAPLGTTEIKFVDGARHAGCGTPECHEVCTNDRQTCYSINEYYNAVNAGGDGVTPFTIDSFVLVNGLLEIVADVSFFRGDANSDLDVNISDAIATLDFLFQGGREITCKDAADSNDDGQLDLSDAVNTLNFLFSGTGGTLPPPALPLCGDDPTPDSMEECLGRVDCK